MAVIETWIKTDLKSIVKVNMFHGILFSQDNMANLIGVELLDGGEPATVTGSVSANVLIADGTTVAVAGTLSGNKASVTLPQAAYAVPGMLAIVIKLTTSSTVTTIGAIQSIVYRASTDTIIDPGTIIPSVQDLIAAIEEAVESIPPDYSELTGEVSDLKSAFGEYTQDFTMSTQYLATFYCENTGAFYFKLLKHPTATYSGVRIYGVSGTTETGIQTTPIPLEEFYWSGISSDYDRIKITVGFGSQVSGNVSVILAPNGGDNVSAQTVNNTVTIKDLIRSVDKNKTGDLYKDLAFISGKNISSNFSKCTVDTYKNILTSSQVGSVSDTAVRIRDDNGNLYANIYFVVPSALDNGSATMCWTFDKNGNPIGNIAGNALNNGFDSNVYYIVLINYSNNEAVSAIYDSGKEYIFEVASSGKPFSSFCDCVKRTSIVPYKKIINVYSGEYNIYNEIGGDTFANAIPSGTNWRTVSIVVGNNTKVIGIGRVVLKMESENINSTAVQLLSPLNVSGNVTIENIQIVCKNCRYGIHIEGSSLAEYNNTVCTLRNVIVTRNVGKDESGYNGPALGVGMNARSKLIIESCKVEAKGGWAGLYFHENTSTLELSPQLEIKNSIFEVASGYGLALSASANQTTMIDTFIESSYIDKIRKMTGGSSAFDDAYAIVMLNCNMPTFSASELMQNEVAVKHYNTIQ